MISLQVKSEEEIPNCKTISFHNDYFLLSINKNKIKSQYDIKVYKREMKFYITK